MDKLHGPTPEQMGYKKAEGPDEFGVPYKEGQKPEPVAEKAEWGTPLTDTELEAIGFKPGDSVRVNQNETGVILEIKNYDIDGGTIMALVENPDKSKVQINVRVLSRPDNKS